jgi:nicotinate-nucleotide adenylyltransferase
VNRVALFGGSFNPPHLGHAMACLYVLETQKVDLLWMLPAFRHPFGKDLAPFEHRVAMCELLARGFGGRVQVCTLERDLEQEVNRTLDTLRALCERHPDCQFRLVVGADILAETASWHRWDEIERLAEPVVIGRVGYGDAELNLPDVSSTEVRRRIAAGKSAVPLVSRAVMDYIAEQGLYT